MWGSWSDYRLSTRTSSISRSEASAGGADVGQRAIGCAGEVQEMAEDVLDTLQRHFGVGVWHFTEVEEQVVEGLQDVVAALGAGQIKILVRAL